MWYYVLFQQNWRNIARNLLMSFVKLGKKFPIFFKSTKNVKMDLKSCIFVYIHKLMFSAQKVEVFCWSFEDLNTWTFVIYSLPNFKKTLAQKNFGEKGQILQKSYLVFKGCIRKHQPKIWINESDNKNGLDRQAPFIYRIWIIIKGTTFSWLWMTLVSKDITLTV